MDNNLNGVVKGLIGKQKDLYTAQIAGFSRDAEQKAAKIVVDFATALEASRGISDYTAMGLGNSTISAIVTKLKNGI